MPDLVLASGSPARRALLRQLGLDFTVAVSRAAESRVIRTSCAELVVENALAKARDVARRRKRGIIIGADTVVLVGRKIIGKPRDLSDARRTLRLLASRPQWVYSGIAVIDAASGRTLTDHEKTRVFMRALTDAQIARYFRKVSPLDKAGSFDIQGLGSIFIDRIEGCFYNVVGLPLAKLGRLLARLGVDIF